MWMVFLLCTLERLEIEIYPRTFEILVLVLYIVFANLWLTSLSPSTLS